MKISLHIHSEYSMDAKQTVASIIEESRKLGIDAVAITDHNTVAGSRAASLLHPDPIIIVIGAEFSTDKGHILALFIDEKIEQSCNKPGDVFDFDDLVAKVRAQGGLLFLAHPLQSSAVRDPSFIAALDGYELINARLGSSFKARKAKALGEALQAAFPDKLRIGGSDAHTSSELGSVYMTSGRADAKEALLDIDSIVYRPSSMTKIRFGNIVNNKGKSLKFYVRQLIMMVLGLPYDLRNKIKGDSHEVVRVCEKSQ
jgi:predicted metal-dependent phosphoesterase TrpH